MEAEPLALPVSPVWTQGLHVRLCAWASSRHGGLSDWTARLVGQGSSGAAQGCSAFYVIALEAA